MKMLSLVGLLSCVQCALAMICVNTTTNYKVFGSGLHSNMWREPFVMALQSEGIQQYKVYKATNDTQLIDQVSQLAEQGCTISLGLFISKDCLIAGPALKRQKITAFSPSCSANSIGRFFPYLYTAIPKLSQFLQAIVNYIHQHASGKTIYAFYQPYDIYSYSGYKHFKQLFHGKMIPVAVDSNGQFTLPNSLRTKGKENIFVFLTYPLPSAQILAKLDDIHQINKNATILGASSWLFDTSVFKYIRPVFKKANKVLVTTPIKKKDLLNTPFAKKFYQQFHRTPSVIDALAYDFSRLAAQCYKSAMKGGHLIKPTFLYCINHNRFHGVTGPMPFAQHDAFANKKIYLDNLIS